MSERGLWQEVLLRAIMDARLEPSAWPIPANAYDETAEARRYLTTPSKDLATVCSLAGVDMNAMIDRMRKQVAAVPPLAAMEPAKANPRPPRVRDKLHEHDGKALTIAGWSRLSGIPGDVIRNRLYKGWTMDKAVTVPVDAKRSKKPKPEPKPETKKPPLTITHEGETLTHHQWAERTGLSWFTIRDRVRKGWPVEEVLRPGDRRGAHMRVEAA